MLSIGIGAGHVTIGSVSPECGSGESIMISARWAKSAPNARRIKKRQSDYFTKPGELRRFIARTDSERMKPEGVIKLIEELEEPANRIPKNTCLVKSI